MMQTIIFVTHHFACAALASALVERGFFVAALDHSGHGRSEGVRSIPLGGCSACADDVLQLATLIVPPPAGIPKFLLGHSMGGLISVLAVLKSPDDAWAGLALSAPFLGLKPTAIPVNPCTVCLLGSIAGCAPQVPVEPPLPISGLCSSVDVQTAYQADPLVYRGHVLLGAGIDFIRSVSEARAEAPKLRTPLFLAISEIDSYVLPSGALAFFDQAGSPDKSRHVFEAKLGLQHEIFNEPNSGAIPLFVEWLAERTSKK